MLLVIIFEVNSLEVNSFKANLHPFKVKLLKVNPIEDNSLNLINYKFSRTYSFNAITWPKYRPWKKKRNAQKLNERKNESFFQRCCCRCCCCCCCCCRMTRCSRRSVVAGRGTKNEVCNLVPSSCIWWVSRMLTSRYIKIKVEHYLLFNCSPPKISWVCSMNKIHLLTFTPCFLSNPALQ